MNPLTHYFRRPALYFVLPSGKNSYPPHIIKHTETGELPVLPLTAHDELKLKNPDALMNGTVMAEIIASCIPDIIDPWQINTIDWEAVLIAIRAASVGNGLDIDTTCPSCGEESRFEVNLASLLSSQKNIDYGQTLKIRELEVKYRPLVFKEMNDLNLKQFDLQRMMSSLDSAEVENSPELQLVLADTVKKMNNMIVEVVASSIECIKTPHDEVRDQQFIREFLDNCDSKTSKTIQEKGLELRQKNDIKPLSIKCPHCSHEYQQRLQINASDFFE
jgi:Zn finger protein HypA/HybF involved in hydrogenase expression